MIVLFTDFGSNDIYVAQMKVELCKKVSPTIPIVDLLHDAPNFNITCSAHLLAALHERFPPNTTFLTVVDPGVGGVRKPVVVNADKKWFIGPDNGLISIITDRASTANVWQIDWRPEKLSESFHGRDLFAPIAADIANRNSLEGKLSKVSGLDVQLNSGDLNEIIYIDHYGNALTGIRTSRLAISNHIQINNHILHYRRVFSEAAEGYPFWYKNSIGLVEIALNQESARTRLGLQVGDKVNIIEA